MSEGAGPESGWRSPEDKIRAAGLDLMAFMQTAQPAAAFDSFVKTYFPALRAQAISDDLRVTNAAGDEVFVRRAYAVGHGGAHYIKGTQNFETAAIHSVLCHGGGKRRDAKNLIDMLAQFNNR